MAHTPDGKTSGGLSHIGKKAISVIIKRSKSRKKRRNWTQKTSKSNSDKIKF